MDQKSQDISLRTGKKVIDFFGDEPTSIYRMLPEPMQRMADTMDVALLQISERDFLKLYVKEMEEEPNEIDMSIRAAFWEQYYEHLVLIQSPSIKSRIALDVNNAPRINIEVMTAAAGYSRSYFYNYYLNKPLRIAYLLRPPLQYNYRVSALLDLAMTRVYEALKLPLTKTVIRKNRETGVYEDVIVPDTALIGKITDIAKFLELRVKGAVAQKVELESKNLHVHKEINSNSLPQGIDPNAVSIESQLKAIEAQIKLLTGGEVRAHEKGSIEGFIAGEAGIINVTAAEAVITTGEE